MGNTFTPIRCRAIIDTASTKNFITENLAKTLKLPINKHHIPIGALNELTTISHYSVTATIKSAYNKYQRKLEFLAIPQITAHTPEQQFNRDFLKIPANLPLADPEFHKPLPVQLLIGSGTSLSLLSAGQIPLSSPQKPDLILQKSQLGWIIGGSLPSYNEIHKTKCLFTSFQNDLSRFWEIEEGATNKYLSPEETACENHFIQHFKRNPDGRYTVPLPFNGKQHSLGQSYTMALRRLQSLLKRFNTNSDLQKQYSKVIHEYLDLGYITKLDAPPPNAFFLPHQAVIKESSMTTKVRVVFDGSASSSTGLSLNDVLMGGPTIQDDIFSLLLRFRLHNHVLTGDIEKMYLQVMTTEEDRKYLCILWQEEGGPPCIYQFNRLIFGLKPASYLAVRCLHQLADDEKDTYPMASKILKRDLYVDDLLSGADNIEEVIQLREEITNLLRSGGFNLRQCASNTPEVLQTIPDHNINLQLQNNNAATLKTLGVHWNSSQDAIIYTVTPRTDNRTTKRTVCSEIARIYDPLGLLNPVVITAKLIMQELWRLQLDWDESLPLQLHTKWNIFISQLPILNDLSFKRNILHDKPKEIQLHGFCDASEKAYGACLYLLSTGQDGSVRVGLYCAKSRVAPLKNKQTIPRLELCAAALLAEIYNSILKAIHIPIHRTTFWTDSMIALQWIHTSPHILRTFEANRVSNIQQKTANVEWKHVRTQHNPADLVSRGLMPDEFKKAAIWNKGPTWLADGETEWPIQPVIKPATDIGIRKSTCLALQFDNSILTRYSSYIRLQRIIARCLQFRPSSQRNEWLTVEQLQHASQRIIYLLLQIEFSTEIKHLRKHNTVPSNSKLLNLQQFLDNNGLLRVGGRLQNTTLSYQQKHRILLPKSHHVTKLLIQQEHLNTLHGGTQATLYTVRQNYWPIDGRNQVRHVVRACVNCARANPLPVVYPMGSIPKIRTEQTKVFANVGVDYCGPFLIKVKKYRNKSFIKIYVAIFVCMCTKAVNIETVSDLTTDAFLAALRRFISRRGKCLSITSDNATNFVGANNALKDLHMLLTSDNHNKIVHQYLATQGITWHFIPPRAPHFGGLWEAAVKSFKYHLKRVIGNATFTAEQLNTLTIEIEAVLNSRPLTPISADPNDLQALTPFHLINGDSFSSLPQQDFQTIPTNRLSTWQQIQKIKQDFWTRWHKEYINELNVRRKWTKGVHTIKQGSVVLLREDNAPPFQWRLGRVIETYPGSDGIIRTVRLKTVVGECTRCVKKLAPLPTESDSDSI